MKQCQKRNILSIALRVAVSGNHPEVALNLRIYDAQVKRNARVELISRGFPADIYFQGHP